MKHIVLVKNILIINEYQDICEIPQCYICQRDLNVLLIGLVWFIWALPPFNTVQVISGG